MPDRKAQHCPSLTRRRCQTSHPSDRSRSGGTLHALIAVPHTLMMEYGNPHTDRIYLPQRPIALLTAVSSSMDNAQRSAAASAAQTIRSGY